MISYMTFIFMKAEDFPIHETEQVRNLIGLFCTTMVCVVYFNSNWLVTTIGIIINMWVGFTFYVHVVGYPAFPFIMQFIYISLFVSYFNYYSELMSKMEFIKSRENE